MPSSGENSPTADPLGGLGAFDISPGSVGVGSSSKSSASSKRVEGKRCGVCGDRALGYNFNAITCESCKAFFRRNALKNKEYRCPFNDQCEVTAVTRRFCQRCRLRKCFEVGMKKEWIMSEEEKKKKRKKIEENRARKMGDMESSSPSSSSPPSPSGGGMSEQLLLSASSALQSNCSGDADEETRDTFGASVPDHPSLPLKSPSSGTALSKPKAVVVGRVRVEEKEAKVRKVSVQSDVHTPKIVTAASIPTLLPPKGSVISSTQIGNVDTSSPSPPPLSQTSEDSGIPVAHLHPSSYLQHFGTNDPSADSLVVGLLRAHSHGSAEDEPPLPPPQALGCQAGEKHTKISGVIVKKESEEDMRGGLESCMSYEFSTPSSIPVEPTYYHPHSNSFAQESKFTIPNHTRDNAARFDFSIHEALSLIQPGCREKWSSSTFLPSSSGNNVMESIMNTAISAEYSAFSLLTYSLSELNQAETIKITELLEASKGLNSPLCEEPNYKDLPNPSLINVINLTEIAIRRLIKMAKKISAFKMFCQEDQIALLKGGCTEMMILRSVSAYDPDKEVWKIQQDHERFKNIKLKVLKAAPGNVYEEHKRFILSFEPEWRYDTRIIALLAAIALFTPERPNVIHLDAVRHEQSSYLYLLKRYMECTYGGCVGKTYYLKLLKIIGNLHILNEDHVRVFLEVNPQEVEPLLIEIFDLKQS